MDKEIAALKKQRASNKGRLTQILNFLDNAKRSTPIEEFRTRLMRVDKLMSEFTTIESSIFLLDDKEDSDFQYEESYYKAVTGLNTWIRSISSISATSANLDTSVNMTQTGGGHTEVKLPRINIPTFSGEYTEWPSFFDLYCSTIHESQSLNPVQKFQYLKGLLRGEPAILLRHISVTEANYLGALTKLKERYNRKRPIIYSFIRTFIEQPVIHTVNATNIKRLMDTSDEVVRGLKALGDNAETRDPWLIFLLLSKLDDKSKAQWAETTADVDNPSFSDFLKFLARRIDTLESLTIPTRRSNPKPNLTNKVTSNNVTMNDLVFKCAFCQGEHSLFQCQDFNKMNVTSRREWTKNNQRCFNCLSSKHAVFKCTSKRRCMQCKRKHHSLLHDDGNNEDSADTPKSNAKDVKFTACSQSKSAQTILPTAIIKILDSSGHIHNCRALLDSGSQVSFITEACSQRLSLQKRNARLSVSGVGKSKIGYTKGIVRFTVRTEEDGEIIIEALVLASITTKLPPQSHDYLLTDIYQGIKLADPNFHLSSNVDILIGADYFFELLEVGQIKINNIGPVFQKTVFGWVASGKIGGVRKNDAISMITTSENLSIIDIDKTLRRFWEIESISSNINSLSPEEQLCEDKFTETLQQTPDGRFIVGLPFRRSPDCLGVSMSNAIQRLCSMERRFARDSEFKTQYQKFMLEYLELNHMQEIPQEEVNNSGFYLPHHGVLRQASTTTKLRVVFDGSAKSSSGVSLNDCLAVGPKTQSTLYAILLRFREHTIVFSADVEKMYRQVQITETDTKYQKIVWRTNPSESIRHYRLLTVTYGLAAAPFLATRAVKQIALENQKPSPVAANIIQRDIYVDDLMTGADSENEAIQLKDEIFHLLKNRGFTLRKWSSNSEAILDKIPGDDKTNNPKIIEDNSEESNCSVKVLGVTWNPVNDEFTFSSDLRCDPVLTKRTILSQASRLFDPLGWLAPIVISIKIFIQQLWAANLEWDDPLTERRAKEWLNIYQEMGNVSQIRIPRFISTSKMAKIEMHGFCDASQRAYAAVVFFRIESVTGEVSCKLISAKTKVAPIKQASLPRLELCGALLLTNLLNKVKSETQLKIDEVFCWTDSTIVLDWLASHPRRWSTFVGNRTAEILNSWSRKHWRHVPSSENSADCASRGLSPLELKSHKLWWNGPDWIIQPAHYWPPQENKYGHIDEESNHQFTFTITIQNTNIWFDDLISRYSSFQKLNRILSYIFRFINNIRKPNGMKTSGIYLTREEIFNAAKTIYKHEQNKYYSSEIESLKSKNCIGKTSNLKTLHPFIDELGLIRVGGRLENSLVPFSTKHPIILHAKSHITSLFLEDIHRDNKHAGASLCLSIARQIVWVPGGKSKVKEIISRCVVCTKFKTQMQGQLMGNLPRCRVEFVRPFLKTGVDYAGPLPIHLIKGRGQKTYKSYICLFICLSTKAVHLELVTDMTSEAFLGGLKRFIARRGVCQEIYSDNGSNFIGANNQLRIEFNKIIQQSNNISNYSSRLCITWHFNPPSAPHFGGIWEAGVKSTKFHLKRVIGKTILTMEEMSTLLAEIEAILNSRPICALQSDDIDALTPSHFLIGHAATKIPELDVTHLKSSYLSRWQMVQQLSQHFWKRWNVEYLTSLQERTKWQQKQTSIKLNDIVVVRDNNQPTNQYLLGKVINTHPGSDGMIRVVTLKTRFGEMKRPISKLCILPVAADESNEESKGPPPNQPSVRANLHHTTLNHNIC